MGPNDVVPASVDLTGVNSVLNCISAMEYLQVVDAGCEVGMLSMVTARTRHRCLTVGIAPATAFRR